MSQLTTTKTFAAGQRVTHTDLNQITSLATLNPTTYSGAMPGTDNLLFLRGATLGINSWSNITQNATSLTVKPLDGNRYSWVSGGANFLLMEAAGSPLYPIQCLNGAASNSLYLNGDGVGVLNSAPGCALDVTGTTRAAAFVAKAQSPMLALTDTGTEGYAPYYAGFYMSDATLWFSKLDGEAGTAVNTPLAIDVNAGDDTLVIVGTGSAANVGIGLETPAEKLDVAGNIKVSGALFIGAQGAAPASNAGGTVGTLVQYGGDLYLCVAASGANSWKKLSLATY